MKPILTILSFFLFSQLLANAQQDSVKNQLSPRRQNMETMKEQIIKLKNGALLVRLHTKENSINALVQNGQGELAEEVRMKQVNFNKQAIRSFREYFTFCPVYFHFAKYSDNIISGQIEQVIFLNDSLEPDTGIKLKSHEFLTAEFGRLQQDTSKYFSHNYDVKGANGIETKSVYHGGPDLRFEALRIMSDKMIQLKKPFPYYAKTSDFETLDRKLSLAVNKMNKRLFRYYNSVVQ